ncbi:MAG: shikimate dehydrogenase [Acidimicrobiia bacterium]
MGVTARTRVAAVIGHPVRHSLSPLLHNAAFGALGLDWLYVALDVAPGEAAGAVAGMRVLGGLDGLNVTMPHKAGVAAAVDRLSAEAAALGAVNTVVREGDRLAGHNTDGAGFLAALRAGSTLELGGRRCLVVGGGGAARAVVLALGGTDVGEIVVAARRPEAAASAAGLVPGRARPGTVDEADTADLVVNATPVGMDGVAGPFGPAPGDRWAGAVPVEPARLGPGQVVVDLVYQPLETGLLAAAHERGAATVNGVGMLLHQAAAAFRLWTGADAPLEAMSGALAAELEARRSP